MSATPLGFWKLPARPDGAARHLAVITGGEAQQTMLFLQDGQWSILALFQDELAGKAAARTLDAFAAHLRDELDLRALEHELRRVVLDTVHPTEVTLWLRDGTR